MAKLIITSHARFQMRRRSIPESLVVEASLEPQQTLPMQYGRAINQSKYINGALGREMLIRVVVEPRGVELHVVTAYKTSRIEKYWKAGD